MIEIIKKCQLFIDTHTFASIGIGILNKLGATTFFLKEGGDANEQERFLNLYLTTSNFFIYSITFCKVIRKKHLTKS